MKCCCGFCVVILNTIFSHCYMKLGRVSKTFFYLMRPERGNPPNRWTQKFPKTVFLCEKCASRRNILTIDNKLFGDQKIPQGYIKRGFQTLPFLNNVSQCLDLNDIGYWLHTQRYISYLHVRTQSRIGRKPGHWFFLDQAGGQNVSLLKLTWWLLMAFDGPW